MLGPRRPTGCWLVPDFLCIYLARPNVATQGRASHVQTTCVLSQCTHTYTGRSRKKKKRGRESDAPFFLLFALHPSLSTTGAIPTPLVWTLHTRILSLFLSQALIGPTRMQRMSPLLFASCRPWRAHSRFVSIPAYRTQPRSTPSSSSRGQPWQTHWRSTMRACRHWHPTFKRPFTLRRATKVRDCYALTGIALWTSKQKSAFDLPPLLGRTCPNNNSRTLTTCANCFMSSCRAIAEQFLNNLEKSQNFGQLILQLIATKSFDLQTRFSASLFFKNFVRRNWLVTLSSC